MKTIVAFSFGLGLLASALAADVVHWKDASGWDISLYPSVSGCQAFTVHEGGTGFFMGFAKIETTHLREVTLMNEDWETIEDGKNYRIKATFGDETPWTLNMNGQIFGDVPGQRGRFDLDKADLLAEAFHQELAMVWSHGNSRLGHFNLRGSRVAFQEAIACQ